MIGSRQASVSKPADKSGHRIVEGLLAAVVAMDQDRRMRLRSFVVGADRGYMQSVWIRSSSTMGVDSDFISLTRHSTLFPPEQ